MFMNSSQVFVNEEPIDQPRILGPRFDEVRNRMRAVEKFLKSDE
jgi:hypothetical protein